jgi:hypothetical protein
MSDILILDTIITRLEVGLNKESTPDCEWYDGIEHDALTELKSFRKDVGRIFDLIEKL